MLFVGTQNAKWLKIKPFFVHGMIAVCILAFVSKYSLLWMMQYGFFGLNMTDHFQAIKQVGRVLYLAVAVLYVSILNGAYKKHMHSINTTEKLKPYVFRYGLISTLIEATMIIIIFWL